MEQRISLITLACRNVPAAKAFYERLGWTPAFSNDDVAFFQMAGLVFGLYGRRALSHDVGRPEDQLRPGGAAIAHNVASKSEVAAVMANAVEAGATVVVPPADTPWGGHSGYFADPDGHLWEVAWNPAWTIDSDGATRVA